MQNFANVARSKARTLVRPNKGKDNSLRFVGFEPVGAGEIK